MELALVGDGAASQQQVRLKLHFEDKSILSAEQLQDGLADSWFLVASHLRSISDLASHIIIVFGLVNACPHGIALRMENFTLPPSLSVRVIKDKDIVSVNKKYVSPDAVQQQVKHVHGYSFDTFDKIAPFGVKICALEKFERAMGGYEREQEEENDTLQAGQKDNAPKTSSTKLKQKKRKWENIERGGLTREKEKGQKSKKQQMIVQQDDDETNDKGKKKKSNKQACIIVQDDKEKVCRAGEFQECAKSKNVQEPESSKAIKIKKKNKEQLMTGDVSVERSSLQKPNSLKGNSMSVSLSMRSNEQGITKLQVVPFTSGLTIEKEKGKKSMKQRLIMQQDDYQTRDKVKEKKSNKQVVIIQQDDKETVFQAGEFQECAKNKNVQEPESSKAIEIKRKKKEQMVTGDVSLELLSIQKHISLKGDNKNGPLSIRDTSSDKPAADEERKAGLPVEGERVKKQSRSTLRKKAKRRWRLEHKELTKNLVDKLGDDSRKAAAHKDFGEQPFSNFTTKHEEDGDAEEERLPHVVRPGHIRFEPLDEDDDNGLRSQNSLPRLGWSNGISKRKGQSWGQEKAKRSSKNLGVIDNMEICDSQELEFKALPALTGTPQNGDVIAYRILELTSSFCPDLSEYRVGKVVAVESQTGALKLAEVPEYPLRKWKDDNLETNEDLQFSSLYDKEGFLETQMSSLAEIRLVQGSSLETCTTAPAKDVETEMATTGNDTNLNMSTENDTIINMSTVDTPTLAELARTDNDTNLNMSTENDTNVNTSTVDTQADVDKTCSTNANTTEAHITTEENSPVPFQGWPELFDVIERKKQELGNKEVIVSSGAGHLDESKGENGCSSMGNNSAKDGSTGRARGWHKRAGGLGATMALLRSQNAQ